jgi:hypothetical protein
MRQAAQPNVVETIEYVFYNLCMPALNGEDLTDKRVTGVYLELGDQAEQLLAASDAVDMIEAAKGLRQTALDVRRMLMRPLPAEASLQPDPSTPDPELRRAELANLAVDVVGATDYLLRLLVAPPAIPPRLVLACETGYDQRWVYGDEETADRLIRRRLDARGTAVRLGMRLIAKAHGYATNG